MKKDKKILEVIIETSIYFIGSVIVAILGFILSILYSKMFAPEEYGVYSLAFSMYSLITQIYNGWIATSILRKYEKFKNEGKEDKLFGTFLQLQVIMSILFFIIVNITIYFINTSILMKKIFLYLTIMYFFEQTLLLINTVLRVKQEVKQYNFNTVLNNLLKIVLILILFYILKIQSVSVIAISLMISEIIQVIYLTVKFKLVKFYNRKYFDISIIKKMFLFGFPLIGVGLTGWILNTSDRYIIKYFFTNTEVGLYSYAYSLGNSLFYILIQFIMLGAYPNIVKAWENEGKDVAEKTIKDYLNIYFLVLIPASFGVIGIAKNFFLTFTDVRYQSEYPIFIITCISIAVLGITQYYNKPWELKNRTRAIFIINFVVAIMNVVLNILLIPVFGYQVAAVTTLIAYVFYIIIANAFNNNDIKIKIDIKFLVKILFSALVMLFAVFFIDKVFKGTILTKLILQVFIGAIIYIFMLFVCRNISIKTLFGILCRYTENMKNKKI